MRVIFDPILGKLRAEFGSSGGGGSGNVTTSTGVTNYIPKWTSATNLGLSLLLDDGSKITLIQPTAGVGTVSNSAGGTTVTGVGTLFLSTFNVGDSITIGANTVTVVTITNDTSMITTAIAAAHSGVAYTIVGGNRLFLNSNGIVGINNSVDMGAQLTVSSTVLSRNAINADASMSTNGIGVAAIGAYGVQGTGFGASGIGVYGIIGNTTGLASQFRGGAVTIQAFAGTTDNTTRAIQLLDQAGTPLFSVLGDGIINLPKMTASKIPFVDASNNLVALTVGSGLSLTAGGTLTATGSGSGIVRSVNASQTGAVAAGSTAATDYVYVFTAAGTLTLPTAVGNTNRYTVERSGAGTTTIATTSAQTINGSATATLTVQYQALEFISDGNNWIIV